MIPTLLRAVPETCPPPILRVYFRDIFILRHPFLRFDLYHTATLETNILYSQMNIVRPLVIAPATPPRRCPPRIACGLCQALAGFLGGSSCRRSWERGSRRRYGMIETTSMIQWRRHGDNDGFTCSHCIVSVQGNRALGSFFLLHVSYRNPLRTPPSLKKPPQKKSAGDT